MKSTCLAAGAAALLALGSASLQAYEGGELILHVGPTTVSPNDDSSALNVAGTVVPGSGAEVDSNTQLGITATYMLNSHWGLNLLAATPFDHDAKADTGALGLGKVGAASTKHLPPTLVLQYYPMDGASRFQPFVGAGINYTIFFEEDVDSELESVLGNGDLELDDSWGLAAQLGATYRITDQLSLNATFWYLDIDTTADFDFGGVSVKTDIDIDPWVSMVSLGYKF